MNRSMGTNASIEKKYVLSQYSSVHNIMFYLYCVRITVGSEPDSAGGSSLPGTLATAHNRLRSVVLQL